MAPETTFDASQHLTYADIAVDDLVDLKQLQVNIKQSKTDLFRLGLKVWIGRTGGDVCPVATVLSYNYGIASSGKGSTFCFQNGNPLTRQKLVIKMQEVLQKVDIDCSKYSGRTSGLELLRQQQQRGFRILT